MAPPPEPPDRRIAPAEKEPRRCPHGHDIDDGIQAEPLIGARGDAALDRDRPWPMCCAASSDMTSPLGTDGESPSEALPLPHDDLG